MAPILKVIETRIAVVMNAIAIIVVYFLWVIIFVSCHLFEILFFLTTKIEVLSSTCKFFLHFLVPLWRHIDQMATILDIPFHICRLDGEKSKKARHLMMPHLPLV